MKALQQCLSAHCRQPRERIGQNVGTPDSDRDLAFLKLRLLCCAEEADSRVEFENFRVISEKTQFVEEQTMIGLRK
jgi:hypothetical protein